LPTKKLKQHASGVKSSGYATAKGTKAQHRPLQAVIPSSSSPAKAPRQMQLCRKQLLTLLLAKLCWMQQLQQRRSLLQSYTNLKGGNTTSDQNF
jgi:hypothetical protein